jgi:tetratricopeptide (TPR) repeat protein
MNRALDRLPYAQWDRGTGRPLRWGGLMALCAIVAGCASTPPSGQASSDPPQDPPPAPDVALPAEQTVYELQQRERAGSLARQGRLAEAALTWEVLATIRPNVPEYRERLAELQKQIGSGAAERMQRGEQAMARGQVDAAMQQFLAALALQPDNARAADALRAAERERIKRSHLGKLSRNTLTRRAMSETDMGANEAPMDAVVQTEPGTPAKSGTTRQGRAAGLPGVSPSVKPVPVPGGAPGQAGAVRPAAAVAASPPAPRR